MSRKEIKIYKAKTLFDGNVIGKRGKYVAVPEKGFKGKRIRVSFNGGIMMIENWLKADGYRRFPDKWGRGTYTLGYFRWNPEFDPIVDGFMSPVKLLHDHLRSQQLALD